MHVCLFIFVVVVACLCVCVCTLTHTHVHMLVLMYIQYIMHYPHTQDTSLKSQLQETHDYIAAILITPHDRTRHKISHCIIHNTTSFKRCINGTSKNNTILYYGHTGGFNPLQKSTLKTQIYHTHTRTHTHIDTHTYTYTYMPAISSNQQHAVTFVGAF